MLNVTQNVNLAPYNTFGVSEYAHWFTRINNPQQIKELVNHPVFAAKPHLILGGGSNILFTRSFEGLVIKVDIKGIEKIREDANHVWLKVGAGENWHSLVMHCVTASYGGIENLALIPGTAGAAPVQNIGAYGVELAEVLEEVQGFNLADGTQLNLSNNECRFGYRDSIFKQELKGKFFISSITLRLTVGRHQLRTSYGTLADTLIAMGVNQPTLYHVSQAVIRIRTSKLPDPARTGNAGSFFKNPVISGKQYRELKEIHPKIPGFIVDNQGVKIPAAWLIEQCGWKGKRIGNAGVHEHQPLVLVNLGGASGQEILKLAEEVRHSVAEKFNIDLTPEVNII
ncbi:MAG: UDP-N-acetylenolpyruvoylglucosamine reductase [Cyclobacteriaceae bacterium]|nr:MAG: UDP-N-acetylenolpyruvoylglucosamine reductase [Cyclobacteriaceae bacterium]